MQRTKQRKRFLIILSALGVLVGIGAILIVWYLRAETTSYNPVVTPNTTEYEQESPPVMPSTHSALALFTQQLTPGAILSSRLLHEEKIPLSTTIAKSGEASLQGKGLSDGLFLYLNKVNAEYGGLGNQFSIALDQRDDSGVLLKTVDDIEQLLPSSALFFSPMGDAALEKAYAPLAQVHKAAVIFPVSGMRLSTSHIQTPILFFRPSYDQEVAALVHYAVTLLKKQKIAVFYEESSWGRAGCAAVARLLATRGLSLETSVSYQPGTVNIEAALATMQQAEPHVIICIANGRPAYNFIREAVNKRLHYVSFLGTSQLAGIAQHLLDSRGVTMVTSSVVPNPHNSPLSIVQEYRQDMQKYLPNKGLSTYSLEGYINSMLLTYFLQQLPSTATVGDLIQLIRNTKDLSFKGLALSCTHNTLSHTVWINEGAESTWHEYTVR